MGTNVQKPFLALRELLIDEFLTKFSFTGKCKEKFSDEGNFFSSFVR